VPGISGQATTPRRTSLTTASGRHAGSLEGLSKRYSIIMYGANCTRPNAHYGTVTSRIPSSEPLQRR